MQVMQERDQVLSRRIVWITIGVLIATAAFVSLAALILAAEVSDESSVGRTQRFDDEINHIELTLIEHTAPGSEQEEAKLRRLEGFGWLNEVAGELHIPIEVAMDLYLRERASQVSVGAAPARDQRAADAGSEATGVEDQQVEPRGAQVPREGAVP